MYQQKHHEFFPKDYSWFWKNALHETNHYGKQKRVKYPAEARIQIHIPIGKKARGLTITPQILSTDGGNF